jgi:hypothetical protein
MYKIIKNKFVNFVSDMDFSTVCYIVYMLYYYSIVNRLRMHTCTYWADVYDP